MQGLRSWCLEFSVCSPMQELPSSRYEPLSWKPLLHSQWYQPGRLTQREWLWHSIRPSAHSSISEDTHTSISLAANRNVKLQLTCAFLGCSLMCSGWNSGGWSSWNPSVELGQRPPTFLQPVCHSRDQSRLGITSFSSSVVSFLHFPQFFCFFCSCSRSAVSAQFALFLAHSMHTHALPRGVGSSLLLGRGNLSHPLCMVWALLLFCSPLASGWKTWSVHTPWWFRDDLQSHVQLRNSNHSNHGKIAMECLLLSHGFNDVPSQHIPTSGCHKPTSDLQGTHRCYTRLNCP